MKKHPGRSESESNEGVLAARGEPAMAANPARGLVLVMDDDDMVRRVATSMLRHLGYEVLPAADGSEALQRARSALREGRPLAAAVLDLTVRSGEGGRDVVGPLRELLPSLPIVAASGYSDDAIMTQPKEFGFSASLRKPFLLKELSELLSKLIEDSQR